MRSVLITGADRGVGFALCQQFMENGWKVYAGQFMPDWAELSNLQDTYREQVEIIPLNVVDTESVKNAARYVAERTEVLDMLVNCAGIGGMEDDRAAMKAVFHVNTLGPMRMVEAFLPLMKKGLKRLCFVSSEAGSVSVAHRAEGFAYCMSKTALNMEVRLMFNRLSKEGYTFRLYHPGWVRSYMMGVKSTVGNFEPEETAAVAYAQFAEDRDWEDVLAMTDVSNEFWPF